MRRTSAGLLVPDDSQRRIVPPHQARGITQVRSLYSRGVAGGGGGASVADPTQLPLAESGANSVLPNSAAIGALQAACAAGGHYTDPIAGLTGVRLTNNGSPGTGSWEPSYAEGGPSCSQPWIGGDGNTYYTVLVRNSSGAEQLIDIRYDLIGVSDARSNMRSITVSGEIGIAFSLDPATPRIAHILNSGSKRIDRYNTATNAVANIGNWPWNVAAAGTSLEWLHGQLNDVWFAVFINSNTSVVAFKPSTGQEIVMTAAEAGVSLNEFRLDREDPVVYGDTGADNTARPVWELDTDTVYDARDFDETPRIMNFEHGGVVRGGIVSMAAEQGGGSDRGMFFFRSDTQTLSNFITTPAGSHGSSTDGYESGHWCMNLPTSNRAEQWVIVDSFNGDTSGAKIRRNAIAWSKLSDGQVRLICGSGCRVTSELAYDTYPQPFTSPDGKLLFFTSEMNGSGRWDAFMVKLPTT